MHLLGSKKLRDHCFPEELSKPFPLGGLPVNLLKQIFDQCDFQTLSTSRGVCQFFAQTIKKGFFQKWYPVAEGDLPKNYPKLEFWNEGKYCGVSVTDGINGAMKLHAVGNRETKLPSVEHYRIPFTELPESGGAIVRGSASKYTLKKMMVWHPTIHYPPVELQDWGAGAIALSANTFISFDFGGHATEWQIGRDEEREEDLVIKKSEMRFFAEGERLVCLLKFRYAGEQILIGCSFTAGEMKWITFNPRTKVFSDPLTQKQLSEIETAPEGVQTKESNSRGYPHLFDKMKGRKWRETIYWTAWTGNCVYVVATRPKKLGGQRVPYRVLCNKKLDE